MQSQFTSHRAITRKRSVVKAAFVVLLLAGSMFAWQQMQKIAEQLSPPLLPKPAQYQQRIALDQGIDEGLLQDFAHRSQGTRTIAIPYDWFMALEQPTRSPWQWLWFKEPAFHQSDYLSRFGFLPSTINAQNPDHLPIGFAVTEFQNLPGLNGQYKALGFTCAACHTGSFSFNNQQYIVQGGSANIALDQFNKAIATAIGQTALSAKLPMLNSRFERFAEKVLAHDLSEKNKERLKEDFLSAAKTLNAQPKHVTVTEGFARLDALNRIGNQIFSIDLRRPENYVPPNAPVSYPPIWTASWFNWVQYDGSIMQPLVRNAGEALGVRAKLSISDKADGNGKKAMHSSVDFANLYWIEQLLAGNKHPLANKRFAGLQGPAWPDSLGKIDEQKAKQGEALYQQYCQSCHLPSIHSQEIFADKYWQQLSLADEQASKTLALKKITLAQIGTDPAQATILLTRKINTAKTQTQPAMGIDSEVCSVGFAGIRQLKPNYNQSKVKSASLQNTVVNDSAMLSFALALAAVAEQNIQGWSEQQLITAEQLWQLRGKRPNCIEAQAAYKARPLNGMWATAPFLHNGSVPTLYHLLADVSDRPRFVRLGDLSFDNEKIGLTAANYSDTKPLTNASGFDQDGYFWLDATTAGNSHQGHEFSTRFNAAKNWAEQEKGVIGPALSNEQRMALIEYLKTQ